ncbi:multiple epidermal growth factor-like domains protein 11 [Neocloeon triangulifer]|uniref:multiple epidermal growth factor-like domains protein 11 n=1 Tax=Neocloeon triangulifer TaxID=2078957 RepID=UPI00286F43F1|nr:multiple epidermal growth factor-like domains protein 11 [Neocloeon triangulifer]
MVEIKLALSCQNSQSTKEIGEVAKMEPHGRIFFFILVIAVGCRAVNVGESCETPTDLCTTPNSICDEATKTCVCMERLWFDESACVSALENSCTNDDVQDACAEIPYALCQDTLTNKKCQCENNYVPFSDPLIPDSPNIFCAASSIGNDHCLEAGQCLNIANSECINSRCTCKAGFVPNGDSSCIAAASFLGDPCSTNDQVCEALDENAECSTDGKCACKAFYLEDTLGEKCLPVARKIGDECSARVQCTSILGAGAQCSSATSGICECRSGFVPSLDLSSCLSSSPIGQTCVQNQQCGDAEGSLCKEFTCACKEGYEVINSKCFKTPQNIGDQCAIDGQCNTIDVNAKCTDSTCSCVTGFVPNADFDKCLLGSFVVGTPCTENVQCSPIANSECDILTKSCECKVDYVPSSNKSSCLKPASGLYDVCTDVGQCLAVISGEVGCIKGVCNCKENCHYQDKTCWNSNRLSDSCTDSRECILADLKDRAECKDNVCVCKLGFVADRNANKCNSGSIVDAVFVFPVLLTILLQKLN